MSKVGPLTMAIPVGGDSRSVFILKIFWLLASCDSDSEPLEMKLGNFISIRGPTLF